MVDLIAYHANCSDGFGAAYVAHLKYPEAELLPLDYGADFPLEKFRGKHALMLDWSRKKKEENQEVASVAARLLILDHHKTQKEVLEGEPYAIFDQSRSGVGLAWDYLFGFQRLFQNEGTTFISSQPRPWWVNYIEDRDLWTWKLQASKAVNAFIGSFEHTLEDFKELIHTDQTVAIESGIALLRQQVKFVGLAVKQAQFGKWFDPDNQKDRTVAAVNMLPMHCSEVGEILAKNHDIGMTWFERGDGKISFSLRSDGRIDVSDIAKKFGGGGHKQAAGFEMGYGDGKDFLDEVLS